MRAQTRGRGHVSAAWGGATTNRQMAAGVASLTSDSLSRVGFLDGRKPGCLTARKDLGWEPSRATTMYWGGLFVRRGGDYTLALGARGAKTYHLPYQEQIDKLEHREHFPSAPPLLLAAQPAWSLSLSMRSAHRR